MFQVADATPDILQILPWDSDIDVQVSEPTIAFLAKYYNMTEYHFSLPDIETGRNYLLEINPHYTIRGTEDKFNVIDGRWVDTDTGLFIDISTVRKNYTAIAEGISGALMCKDNHHYLVRSPKLHVSLFISLVALLIWYLHVGKRFVSIERQLLRGLSCQDPIRLCKASRRRVR
jgi:LicD family